MIYCDLCGAEIDSESSKELNLDGGGRVCTYCVRGGESDES